MFSRSVHLLRSLPRVPFGSQLAAAISQTLYPFFQTEGVDSFDDRQDPVQLQSWDSQQSARNAVLVLDGSGSMRSRDFPPSRLSAAQEASLEYARRVAAADPHANIAIVGFARSARVYAPLTPAQQVQVIDQAVRSLRAGGPTNMTAGLSIALQLLNGRSGHNEILFLSDGDHNVGPSPEPLCRELHARATVECIGIGGSPAEVNEELLRTLASTAPDGSKRYRWIGHKDQLITQFRQAAGRLTRS